MDTNRSVAAEARSPSPAIIGAWLLLVVFIGVHYVTSEIATVHYLSIALVAAAVALCGARLSPAQGAVLALAASAVVLGDVIWFGATPGELALEIGSLVMLPVVLWIARSASIEVEATPEGYYWDAAADTSMGRYLTNVETAFVSRALDSLTGALTCAVDAGAGSGRFTRLLTQRASNVIAIEVNPTVIESLAAIGENVTPMLVDENATQLPLRDGSAGCIAAIEVPDLAQRPWFWRESARVLRPGGRLVLTLQNGRSWKGLLARADRGRYRARFGAEYYEMSFRELVAGLEAEGFAVEEASGFNWLPLRRGSDSPLVRPMAALERVLGLQSFAAVSPWVILSARRIDR